MPSLPAWIPPPWNLTELPLFSVLTLETYSRPVVRELGVTVQHKCQRSPCAGCCLCPAPMGMSKLLFGDFEFTRPSLCPLNLPGACGFSLVLGWLKGHFHSACFPHRWPLCLGWQGVAPARGLNEKERQRRRKKKSHSPFMTIPQMNVTIHILTRGAPTPQGIELYMYSGLQLLETKSAKYLSTQRAAQLVSCGRAALRQPPFPSRLMQ